MAGCARQLCRLGAISGWKSGALQILNWHLGQAHNQQAVLQLLGGLMHDDKGSPASAACLDRAAGTDGARKASPGCPLRGVACRSQGPAPSKAPVGATALACSPSLLPMPGSTAPGTPLGLATPQHRWQGSSRAGKLPGSTPAGVNAPGSCSAELAAGLQPATQLHSGACSWYKPTLVQAWPSSKASQAFEAQQGCLAAQQ